MATIAQVSQAMQTVLTTVADAAARRYLYAKNGLFTVVVLRRIVIENSFLVWLSDRPACKTSSDFLNIFLSVNAADAERVKLH